MNIDDLTFGELKQIAAMFSGNNATKDVQSMNKDRLKFRVWDVSEKRYITDQDLYVSDKGVVESYYHFYLDDVKVEQCTGLKDKNGKLIYEGDVVLREMFDGLYSTKRKMKKIPHEIVWLGCGFRAREMTNLGDYKYCEGRCENEFGNCEVIGNIHENPELLR